MIEVKEREEFIDGESQGKKYSIMRDRGSYSADIMILTRAEAEDLLLFLGKILNK